jgi:outer membrane protein OmpA-like peptidoglycan-associated protein
VIGSSSTGWTCAAYNEELSRSRAASVVTWLTDHGIDDRRLESNGYGSRRPIDTNATEEGRAKNRRVVFTILEREPAGP